MRSLGQRTSSVASASGVFTRSACLRAYRAAGSGPSALDHAFDLLAGEAADSEDVTAEERSGSVAAGGAAIGTRILIRMRVHDGGAAGKLHGATVLRYNAEYGHLLRYDDGTEDRTHLREHVWRAEGDMARRF